MKTRPMRADAAARTSLPLTTWLLLVAIVFLPELVPHGPGNTAPVDVLIALYVLISFVGLVRRGRGIRFPALLPFAVIMVASLIALAGSQLPRHGALQMLADVYLFAFFLAIANDLRGRPGDLRLVITVWAVSAMFWALLANGLLLHILPSHLQTLLIDNSHGGSQRAAAATKNPNLAGSYFAISFFVWLASPWPRRKFVKVLGGIWLLMAIFATGSNAGFLGVAAGGVVLIVAWIARSGRKLPDIIGMLGALFVGLGLLAALLFGLLAANPAAGNLAAISQSQRTGSLSQTIGRANRGLLERLDLWATGFNEAGSRMLIGVGPGEARGTVDFKELHNDFVGYFIERGVLGVFGLLLLELTMLSYAVIVLTRGGPGGSGMQALGAAVVADFAFGMFHGTLHYRQVWALFGLLWVASQLLIARDKPPEPLGQPLPEPPSELVAAGAVSGSGEPR